MEANYPENKPKLRLEFNTGVGGEMKTELHFGPHVGKKIKFGLRSSVRTHRKRPTENQYQGARL